MKRFFGRVYSTVLILTAIAIVHAPQSLFAGAFQTLSSLAYQVKNQSCDKLTPGETHQLTNAVSACSTLKGPPERTALDLNAHAEELFFQIAAENQTQQLTCRQNKLEVLQRGLVAKDDFGQRIFSDTYAKLKSLSLLQAELDKNIKTYCHNFVEKNVSPKSTQRYITDKKNECLMLQLAKTTPERLKKSLTEMPAVEKLALENRLLLLQAHAALEASMIESSAPEMKAWLKNKLKKLPGPDEFNKTAPDELAKVFKKISESNSSNLKELLAQKKDGTFQLTNSTKEVMAHDTELLAQTAQQIRSASPQSADDSGPQKVICRIDSRYGRGSDYLDIGIGVGSLILLIPSGGTSATLAATTLVARTGMTGRTALSLGRAMRVTAGGGLTLQTAHDIDKSCLQDSMKFTIKGDSCNHSEVQMKEIDQTNCAVDLMLESSPYLLGLGLVIKGNKKTAPLAKAVTESGTASVTEKVGEAAIERFRTSKNAKAISFEQATLAQTTTEKELSQIGVKTERFQSGQSLSPHDSMERHMLEERKKYGGLDENEAHYLDFLNKKERIFSEGNAILNVSGNYKLSSRAAEQLQTLEIKTLPKGKGAAQAETPALIHPEMDSYLKKAKEMGVRVVIDPSLQLSNGTAAAYLPMTKTIHIKPNSTFDVFKHEFQHAEFDLHIIPNFRPGLMAIQQGKTLMDVLPAEAKSAYGLERAQKVDELMRKNLNHVAINETLSVDEQLKMMGLKQITSGNYNATAVYKYYHQVESFEPIIKSAEKKGLANLDSRTVELVNKMKLDLQEAKIKAGQHLLMNYGAEVANQSYRTGLQLDAVTNNISPTVQKIYQDSTGNLYIYHLDSHWERVSVSSKP